MQSSQPIRLAVVIPAYRPSAGLLDLVQSLTRKSLPALIVVDDGSGPDFHELFARVAEFPGVQLLRHAVNLGKGAALKTAFNHVLCTFPDIVGVVTADADGQHHPDDIAQVADRLTENPDALILGVRQFDEDVPLRSRIGNIATRGIMHALLGQKLTDTQTGLRGIPAGLLPTLLRIESRGYEFELEMLIASHHLGITVIEQPIRTIYEPGNKSSHFNPIVDSMKIYFVLLRFGSVSMMTALIDNLVFYLLWRNTGHILESQIVGRAVAVAFNYWMVRSSVFYSHQQHKTVLPKYLSLVVASGTCSYLGIQFLHGRFGVNTMSAKLLVETVLFFVNFAVQRVFIFKPPQDGGGPSEPPSPKPLQPFAIVLGLAFLALVGVEIYGLRVSNLFAQDIWYPVGLKRFVRFTEIFTVLSGALLLFAPRYFAAILVTLLLGLTAVSVGPLPVLAVLLFLASSWALGSAILGKSKRSVETDLCAILLGCGIYIFLMTWAARLPVNYPAVWGALLAAPILLHARQAASRARDWFRLLCPPTAPPLGARLAFALLALLLTAHLVVVLKPENGADALAMHLAIPFDIAAHHALTFQPARLIWSVMPLGADYAYSVVYLLGGEYAARLLDFAMLALVAGLLYTAVRRWLSPAAACLLAASFVATPIVQLVTGSLFVENVLAAFVLGMMAAIWRFGETGERRYFYLAMVLGGTAMSVKFGAMAFVLAALPFAFVEAGRHWKALGPRPAVVCALAVVLLLASGAPAYTIAWAKTGNPLFPFLNQRFHSTLLPPGTDLQDPRYRQPLTPSLPYRMTFQSSDYYEGQNGSLGFQYLVLVPLGLLALAVARPRPAVSAAGVALVAGLIVMLSQPNARYLYAAIPLALVPFAAAWAWAASHQRALYRGIMLYLVACTALDAYFLPSASYYHKDFSLRSPISRAEKERYIGESAPVRNVIAYFNRQHANAPVLFTHDSQIAGTLGDIYENHWHQVNVLARIRAAATLPEMLHLLDEWKIQYVIAHKPEAGANIWAPPLQEILDRCVVPEFEAGEYYLARIDPTCSEPAEPSLTALPGYYDAGDPAILYHGAWKRQDNVNGPDRSTQTSTTEQGATIRFTFDGKALNYLYSRGPDHGQAEISVDDGPAQSIDMFYAAGPDWQHRTRLCCFAPGRHVAKITVTSAGKPVDIDSFFVER